MAGEQNLDHPRIYKLGKELRFLLQGQQEVIIHFE